MQTCLGIIREGFKGTGLWNCPFPMFAFFSQREVMKIVFLSISWSLYEAFYQKRDLETCLPVKKKLQLTQFLLAVRMPHHHTTTPPHPFFPCLVCRARPGRSHGLLGEFPFCEKPQSPGRSSLGFHEGIIYCLYTDYCIYSI